MYATYQPSNFPPNSILIPARIAHVNVLMDIATLYLFWFWAGSCTYKAFNAIRPLITNTYE